MHPQVPLASVPRGCWLNLSLPLGELVPALFRGAGGGGGAGGAGGAAGAGGGGSSSVFRSLDALQLAGGCQLRRICTLREAPQRMECGPDGVGSGGAACTRAMVRNLVWEAGWGFGELPCPEPVRS